MSPRDNLGYRCFLLVSLCTFAAAQHRVASADEAPPAATPDTVRPATPDTATPDTVRPATATPATVTPAAKPSEPSLDFDVFGDSAKPGTPNAPGANLKSPATDPLLIERQVKRRRKVLELHQGFGFATLAALAATVVIGQLNYIDKYGGGDSTNRYQTPHLALSMGSTALFATTGLLGLCAPTPYKKPVRADSALLHKIMMGIATAGFAAEIALGFATAAKGGELYQRDLALGHLVTGYTTFAAMTAGYLAFVF